MVAITKPLLLLLGAVVLCAAADTPAPDSRAMAAAAAPQAKKTTTHVAKKPTSTKPAKKPTSTKPAKKPTSTKPAKKTTTKPKKATTTKPAKKTTTKPKKATTTKPAKKTTTKPKKATTTKPAKKPTTKPAKKPTTTAKPTKKPTTTTKPAKKTTTTTRVVKTTATATKTSAPAPSFSNSPEQMSQVVDCQTQCINLTPPFGHPPDISVKTYMKVKDYGRMNFMMKNMQTIVRPCTKNLLKLKGNSALVTEDNFNEYVLCNSKTLTKNEDVYFAKDYNWKKQGFSQSEWTQFRNHTLPGFRRALHICRGGCRRIHFAHKGAPKP